MRSYRCSNLYPAGSKNPSGHEGVSRQEQKVNRVKRQSIALSVLVVFTAVGAPAAAQTLGPANVDYSLFNPVPNDKLRELSTDRPGKSHSAITVDAGHIQIESDFLNYTYDPHGNGDVTTHAYSIGTPILKLGVTNWMDVELGLALFNSLHQSSNSSTGNSNWDVSAHGFGDTLLGAKVNAFGNDGGDQSLAFLPFLKIPTASPGLGNGHVEFTLNVPYTIALSKPWSLTLEPNIGVLRNIDNRGPRIIAVAGNPEHLWSEQRGIKTRTKRNHSRTNSGRLTIGGNYSRSPTPIIEAITALLQI